MSRPTAFRCTLAPQGRTFDLTGEATILDAALAQSVAVPFSCRRGECGSCRAQVLSGSAARVRPPSLAAYRVRPDEILMCQCRATSDLTLAFAHWTVPACAPARYAARVEAVESLRPDVTRLVVDLQQAGAFVCEPGQHMHVLTASGERRSFSIANLPTITADRVRLEFHIRRVPGGAFTDRTLATLRPGDALSLDGPHGDCGWREAPQEGTSLVLLATGTGYAGVSAILRAALRSATPRRVTLYWGGREAADRYDAEALDELARRFPSFRWEAPVRHVQDAALADGHDWSATRVHACGHPAMVTDARASLTAAGLPPARFHAEAFVPQSGHAPPPAPVAPSHPWERVGARFTLDGILQARERSREALARIVARIEPGMTARDMIDMADTLLRAMGSACNWHPTYARIGADTPLGSRQPIDPGRRLQREDIFTVDLGPVWDGYEGDYGDTFHLGADEDHARCVAAARAVFDETRAAWLHGRRGIDLYAFAQERAASRGCTLVRETAGHRVSDFPHALYGGHRLAEADFIPASGIWVLEVHVRDLVRPIGAFFEDVLLDGLPRGRGVRHRTDACHGSMAE
ncbi:2Fe-2S ferredoxin [Roseateles aquatilis]|uniref:2Fe-2S ferredoxin n=1 Tax=Roseateles aquatilis TaxID=431061 RepID=A0A246JCZ9_9BURK|nr:M24 family metallopeptidase [Roseateles aquatilis]OWQ90448.1 2Fe-2S ferredoxin [Roseateles aquatilis]